MIDVDGKTNHKVSSIKIQEHDKSEKKEVENQSDAGRQSKETMAEIDGDQVGEEDEEALTYHIMENLFYLYQNDYMEETERSYGTTNNADNTLREPKMTREEQGTNTQYRRGCIM